MKKLLILFFAVFALSACKGPTPEEKGKALAEAYLKPFLTDPNSLVIMQIDVDSAFTPNTDPEILSKAVECVDFLEKAMEQNRRIERLGDNYDMLVSMSSYDSYSQRQIQKAKDDLERALNVNDKYIEKIQKYAEEFATLNARPKSHYGWLIGINFRYQNANEPLKKDNLFIVTDKEFSEAKYVMSIDELQKISDMKDKLLELGIYVE